MDWLRRGMLASAGALLFGAGATRSEEAPGRWKAVETLRHPWRKGVAPYIFIVEWPAGSDDANDAGSARLRIVGPTGRVHALDQPSRMAPLSGELGAALAAPKDNLLESRYLYLMPRMTNAWGEPMLLIHGESAESDGGWLRIFRLDVHGAPVPVLALDSFIVESFQDLDGDGVPELIGSTTAMTAAEGDCTTTYDPDSVYKFSSPSRARLVYSLNLSRAYNKRNYVWAGPHVREDIGVSHCDPKRLKVVPYGER